MSAEANEIRLHFLDYWRVIRVRLGIVILAFLLVVLTTAVTTYFTPKQYRSTVTMEVQPDTANVKIFDPSMHEYGGDPRFAPTQFQILQRTEILYPVVDSLNLQERWAEGSTPLPRQQAFAKLRSMMSLQEVRNTNLIEISILSENPNEAAEIANAIADVYARKRIEEQRQRIGRAMAELDNELKKQQEKVEEARNTMLRIAREKGITDVAPEMDAEYALPVTQLLVNQEQEVDQQRREVAAMRTKIKQIELLEGDALMRALTTLDIPDPTVQQILPQYQALEAREAEMLNSGLGVNHPSVKALRAQKQVFTEQLQSQIESIRKSLAINLEIAEATLADLESKLASRRTEQQDARSLGGDYIEAKNNFAQARRILETAEMRYQTQLMELGMPQIPAKIWQPAEPATFPAKPKVAVNMALGVLVGLIVGIGLAFFIEYLDTSVKTLDDVESYLETPVLAVIPQGITLLHQEPTDTPDAEAYRILRTNIEFNRKSADANSITLVSGGPGEGKSTTLANLAFTCAQGGYNVLIVDADLRRPVQHHLFNLDNSVGLTNYLTTDLALEDVIVPTGIDNLYLMPSGILPSDAVGILNSQRMSDMIADLKQRFDIVFFDSPPILGVSDASVLSSEVDLTIIVVQHRRFPRAMLQRVKSSVENVGGTVLGVVLNNVDTKHDQSYEYYTSYYKYYYSGPSQRDDRKSKPAAKPQDLAATGKDDY